MVRAGDRRASALAIGTLLTCLCLGGCQPDDARTVSVPQLVEAGSDSTVKVWGVVTKDEGAAGGWRTFSLAHPERRGSVILVRIRASEVPDSAQGVLTGREAIFEGSFDGEELTATSALLKPIGGPPQGMSPRSP